MSDSNDDGLLPALADDLDEILWGETPGDTHLSVPRLDRRLDGGLGPYSPARVLAHEVVDTAKRAEWHAGRGEDDEARSLRLVTVGLMTAYQLMVRPIFGREEDPRDRRVYADALNKVTADVAESVAFWDPHIEPLEEYHRLTKVQQARPDFPGLADQRALALLKVYETGKPPAGDRWSYGTLATEIGMEKPRVQQLLKRGRASREKTAQRPVR